MLHKIPGVFLEKNINRDIGCKKFQQCCNPSSLMVDQVEKVPLPVEAQGLRKKMGYMYRMARVCHTYLIVLK